MRIFYGTRILQAFMMKFVSFVFCAAVFGASAVQAEVINRRQQCDKWEHIPASDTIGNPETAMLFCTEEDRTWMALRIECLADEKRMAVTYRPGFAFTPPAVETTELTVAEAEDDAPVSEEEEAVLIDSIPLESETDLTFVPEYPDAPREMVFFDFSSFGYTSVAYYLKDADNWKLFEAEPLNPMFAKLISGSYADVSLLASGTTERFPLRGSGKALRPVVETCRLAKQG